MWHKACLEQLQMRDVTENGFASAIVALWLSFEDIPLDLVTPKAVAVYYTRHRRYVRKTWRETTKVGIFRMGTDSFVILVVIAVFIGLMLGCLLGSPLVIMR